MIQIDDTLLSACVKMAEGNPGAATVAAALMRGGPMGMIDLCHADDLGLRGPKLWDAYKRCDRDINKLREALRNRDREKLGAEPGRD